MFWLPDHEGNPFSGTLRLKAGKSARLDTASFNNDGMANWFPNRPKPEKGETITLTGEDLYKAMSPPAEDYSALVWSDCRARGRAVRHGINLTIVQN
jgi:hypothetical protein